MPHRHDPMPACGACVFAVFAGRAGSQLLARTLCGLLSHTLAKVTESLTSQGAGLGAPAGPAVTASGALRRAGSRRGRAGRRLPQPAPPRPLRLHASRCAAPARCWSTPGRRGAQLLIGVWQPDRVVAAHAGSGSCTPAEGLGRRGAQDGKNMKPSKEEGLDSVTDMRARAQSAAQAQHARHAGQLAPPAAPQSAFVQPPSAAAPAAAPLHQAAAGPHPWAGTKQRLPRSSVFGIDEETGRISGALARVVLDASSELTGVLRAPWRLNRLACPCCSRRTVTLTLLWLLYINKVGCGAQNRS